MLFREEQEEQENCLPDGQPLYYIAQIPSLPSLGPRPSFLNVGYWYVQMCSLQITTSVVLVIFHSAYTEDWYISNMITYFSKVLNF